MPDQTLPLRLSLLGEQPTEVLGTVRSHSMGARASKAAVALLGFWLFAAVCVLIPILHFVLVPGFVLVGIIVAIVRLRRDQSLVEVKGPCPRCKVQGRFNEVGRFRSGCSIHCEGCGCNLTVTTPEPAVAPKPASEMHAA